MICGKITNLVEGLKAAAKGKDIPAKYCRRKAVFAAPVKGTKGLHVYCAKHFLSHWLHADLSKKVKLL